MKLPESPEAERMILGAVILDPTHYASVAGTLGPEDWTLESHRRIWSRIREVHESGAEIDRITVMEALHAAGELESVGGLTYLISLDDGLPNLPSVDDYVRRVKDKSILRKIVAASTKLSSRAIGNEDPDQILADAGAEFLRLAEGCSDSSFLDAAAIIAREGGMNRYLDRRGRAKGISTGYPTLDKMTGGLAPGGLYVLGARPRMGKTALALNIAERVSVDGPKRTAIFSLEMGDGSLLDRLICSRARVNLKRFAGGWLNEDERRAIGRAAGEIAADGRVLIDQKANTSVQEIHAKTRKAQAHGGLDLVIIDYLQLLLEGDDKFRVAEMSRISRNAKVMAKDCGIPVIALCQLSRAVDQRTDHRPQLSDLRESGAIEQDADVVGFLFREDVYRKPDDPKDGTAELILAKQRDGPEGWVPLVFHGEIVRFEEAVKEAE